MSRSMSDGEIWEWESVRERPWLGVDEIPEDSSLATAPFPAAPPPPRLPLPRPRRLLKGAGAPATSSLVKRNDRKRSATKSPLVMATILLLCAPAKGK